MRQVALFASAVGAAALLVMATADSADARRRHRGYYRSSYHRYSRPPVPTPAERPEAKPGARQNRAAVTPPRSAPKPRPTFWDYSYTQMFTDVWWGARERGAPTASAGPASATMVQLTAFGRLCQDQATELAEWPLDEIKRLIRPTAEQEKAIEGLRAMSSEQAGKLRAACASDGAEEPAAKSARMRAGMAAIETAVKTLKTQLEAFYQRLDEEQKARVLSVTLRADGVLDDQQRARRICQPLPSYHEVLAPIERIVANIEPTAAQQSAIYTLGAVALKGAVVIQQSCPSDIALTPMKRLGNMAGRIAALSQALGELSPALTALYDDLSETQKASLERP